MAYQNLSYPNTVYLTGEQAEGALPAIKAIVDAMNAYRENLAEDLLTRSEGTSADVVRGRILMLRDLAIILEGQWHIPPSEPRNRYRLGQLVELPGY